MVAKHVNTCMLAFPTATYGSHDISNAAVPLVATMPEMVVPHVVIANNNCKMCCWTHELGKNCNHTGTACNNRVEGHEDEATDDYMRGGSSYIMSGIPPTMPKLEDKGSLSAKLTMTI